jgi:hypothetical protein
MTRVEKKSQEIKQEVCRCLYTNVFHFVNILSRKSEAHTICMHKMEGN